MPKAQNTLLQSSWIKSPPVSGITKAEEVVGEGLGLGVPAVNAELVDGVFVAVGAIVPVEEGTTEAVGVLVGELVAD